MFRAIGTLVLITVLGLGLSQAQTAADYGLQEGKPFDGTELNFLICCTAVAQFSALIERTNEVFTPLTGITVTWSDTPYGTYKDKILTEASSGAGNFDLVAWVDSWGPQLQPFILPLDELAASSNVDLDDYPEAYLEAARLGSEDTLYGLPFRGHAFMLFYRKDVLEQAGLEVPTTWQEVYAAAKTISEQTDYDGLSLYYGVGTGQNLFVWMSMLWGAGGDIFDADMKPIFNNEAGIAATELYVSFLKDGLTSPDAIAATEQEGNLALAQGQAAMFPGWSWIYESFTNPEIALPEVTSNLGFVAAPGWEGGEQTSYGYIWPVGILNSSRNQEAAWEYLKWLTSENLSSEVVLDKSNPALSTVIATRFSALTSPEVNATTGGLQDAMAVALRNARTQPLIPEWLDVQSVLETAINEIAGGADVKETLDFAAEDVGAIMERAGY
jgi:multiple sugar transport system substrate-binding protein